MVRIDTKIKIRLVLVFFLCFLFSSCESDKKLSDLTIEYDGGRAISVSFKSSHDSNKIFVKENNSNQILGDYDMTEDGFVRFTPVVPFSVGQTYEIRNDGVVLEEFNIEFKLDTISPEILNIYPTTDTVPQNLLKIYIHFSEPMQAIGNSKDFIKVVNKENGKDTSIFLELQNELWNKDRTLLTLWLDPGRIKQDLIPNKEKGIPIIEENSYEIKISDMWRSATGQSLSKTYSKLIYVNEDDRIKPKMNNWNLIIPENDTLDHLTINFNEILDSQLALETIAIYNEHDNRVKGSFKLVNLEQSIEFYPENKWQSGNYKIKIESRLEDLAGNNLSRLFDTDLENTTISDDELLGYHQIDFTIDD